MGIRSVAKRTTKRIGRVFGFSEVNDILHEIKNSLSYSNEIIDKRLSKLEASSKALEEELRRSEKINELYFDALFAKDNETNLEMQKRFFKKLPEATGDLRLIQQGSLKLLQELDKICKANNISYTISDGTLLGAVRHGKMVPWDDDVDTYFLRDDLNKLIKAVSGTDYKVSIAYDPFVVSKQVRFASKDSSNPCFVDIFMFDYCTKGADTDWQKWLEKRNEVINYVHNSNDPKMKEWIKKGVINNSDKSPLLDYVENFFEKTFGGIKNPIHEGGPLGVTLQPKSSKKCFIAEGLDNLIPVSRPDSPRIFKPETLLPTSTISFEGQQFPYPNDADLVLRTLYGDFYSLPKDLVSHYVHVSIDAEKADAIRKFLEK